MTTTLFIAAGGAIGSVLRHYTGKTALSWLGGGFPYGTLAVNIFGSFIMGLLVAAFAHIYDPPQPVKAFLTVGLLGGYTTFSSFSLDAITMYERGQMFGVLSYIGMSVLGSLFAIFAGMIIVRSMA